MTDKRMMIAVSAFFIAAAGCCPRPDLERSRAEILDLHASFVQAHLDRDAALLAEPTADDYLSVINGHVRHMNADDVEAMLAPYLEATDFSHYEDVAEPIVGLSDDGSLAWAIVQVRVAGDRTDNDGAVQSFDTLWAWLTLYRRDGDRWQRIVDVSTNRPFDQAR